MADGNPQHRGVPGWAGPLLIGLVVAVAGSFLGAVTGFAAMTGQQNVKLAELTAKFESWCDRVKEQIGGIKESIENIREENKEQDAEIDRIREILRLPHNR
jgi:hypothetical protein